MARNTSVTLGDHFDEFVAEKISAGRFHSVSEVVRAGLRKLEDDETKLELLREKLKAGEKSPLVDNFDGAKFVAKLNENHLNKKHIK